MSGDAVVRDLADEAATLAFGAELARACPARALIFLSGDLGAGKTTLARGFLHALGHVGKVKSPTYTLVEPYRVDGRALYHLDLYRVADPAELEYLGLREMLGEDALVLIEWPERGGDWLPEPDLRVRLAVLSGARRIHCTAGSGRGAEILATLAGTSSGGTKTPVI
jgi:tRNA threonylcarbamoyladenosine biosynthesis protein TsaE